MTIPLTTYAKTKENYCIGYFGLNEEYLDQLITVRPLLEDRLPGLSLYIAYNDKLSDLAEGKERTVPYSSLQENLGNFGYFYEIKDDLKQNPVEKLLIESGIALS